MKNFPHNPDELLKMIPEHLRDEPHPDLLGETPRQAVGHVKDTSCLTCRAVLRWLAEAGQEHEEAGYGSETA